MRLRLILTGLLLTALVGGAAEAQSGPAPKLRGKFTTPTLTATPSPDLSAPDLSGLRGPLAADASASAAVAPTAAQSSAPADDDSARPQPPAAIPAPRLAARQSFAAAGLPIGTTGGLAASGLPTLPAMPPVGDPAPICRAQCSKARAFCPSDDDPGCDSQWAQCIAGCSGAAVQ